MAKPRQSGAFFLSKLKFFLAGDEGFDMKVCSCSLNSNIPHKVLKPFQMKNNLLLNDNRQWTGWQKMGFRFFFIFFILHEFFSDGLYILSFGYSREILFRIAGLAEKIFVPPCLWLNNHIFHFNYVPESWTTFSPSLRTIRDIVYLLTACVGCLVWSILDRKRTDYNRLFFWFSRCQVIILSCFMFSYGILKLFPVQMWFPTFTELNRTVGELSPYELIWITFGYGTPYQVFCGFFEVLGAVLILFNRTRLTGLFMLSIVMVNVILINYTYQVGVLIFSFYLLLIALFLLTPYTGRLLQFFLNIKLSKQPQANYMPVKNFKFFKTGAFILMGIFFLSHVYSANERYTKRKNADHSRQFSLVKNYIVDNDTLKSIENDALRWRIWSEIIVNGKRSLTISTMKPGADKNYRIEQDSAKQILTLHPLNPLDSNKLNFSYTNIDNTNWSLEGTIQHKNIKVEFRRINPDTVLTLLKVRRDIIVFDDKPDAE
jgi:hypothetical protein